jgi:hypothetical protein
MANIAITNTKITAINTDQALTFNAADEDGANTAQTFVYTPTGKDNKVLIGIQVADTHGTVTWSVANGVGVFARGAKTGSTAQATTDVIQLESGNYASATGTISITFTPASGKRLTSDHALNVFATELIPN